MVPLKSRAHNICHTKQWPLATTRGSEEGALHSLTNFDQQGLQWFIPRLKFPPFQKIQCQNDVESEFCTLQLGILFQSRFSNQDFFLQIPRDLRKSRVLSKFVTFLVSPSRDWGESEARTSAHFCKKWQSCFSGPELLFSAVHNFLRTEGIRLTLTGHQHVGDAKSVTSFVFSSNGLFFGAHKYGF